MALLATHIGEEPLSHEHGFPLRLVAPCRRGFEWVKVGIGKALRPFPPSKRSMRLSPHCAFQYST